METLEYSENRVILRSVQENQASYVVITLDGSRYEDHFLGMETMNEQQFVLWLMQKEPKSPLLADYEVIVKRKQQ